MAKKNYLITNSTVITRAAFLVIDAHNHLWGNWQVDRVLKTMDEVGVISYCDLTGNVHIEFADGGYVISPGNISDFLENCAIKYPGRFYCFTMSNFAQPANKPLFYDSKRFVAECIETLNNHVQRGAKGLKILKDLGLHYRDSDDKLINCNDTRLAPIWEEAGRLKIPVLIHQADPEGFFHEVSPENEHYESLKKYPSWSPDGAKIAYILKDPNPTPEEGLAGYSMTSLGSIPTQHLFCLISQTMPKIFPMYQIFWTEIRICISISLQGSMS